MTEEEIKRLYRGEKVIFKTDITAAIEAGIHEDFARRFAGKSVTILSRTPWSIRDIPLLKR